MRQTITFIDDFKELAEFLGVTEKALWKLGICGDDYNYFLVVEGKHDGELSDYIVEESMGLLRGACDRGIGHNIVVKKKKYWVGGAYHA